MPTMTAAQNIELGNEKLITSFKKLNIQAQQLLQSLNFHIDPATPIGLLGTAKRQMVEIARAVYNDARIIIFDEPTASLTPEEIVPLFQPGPRPARARRRHHLHLARARGKLCRFPTASRCCGTASWVITRQDRGDRRGKSWCATWSAATSRRRHYAAQGRPRGTPAPAARKVLTVENVTMGTMVKNMSFSVYAGEVVGIDRLVGSGRTESPRSSLAP